MSATQPIAPSAVLEAQNLSDQGNFIDAYGGRANVGRYEMKRLIRALRYVSYGCASALFCIVICAAVWWIRLPRYHGSTIYHWFNRAVSLQYFGTSQEIDEIQAAFQAMGADASRFLVERTRHRKDMHYRDYSKFPWSILNGPRIPTYLQQFFQNSIADHRYLAYDFLRRLGTNNIAIQRDIERALSDGAVQDVDLWLEVLGSIGTSASNNAPLIINYFESRDELIHLTALSAFAQITPSRSPQAKLLIKAVENNLARASEAIPILGKLEIDYDALLPILGREFQFTNKTHQVGALLVYDRLPKEKKSGLCHALALSLHKCEPRIKATTLGRIQKSPLEFISELDLIIPLLHDEYYFVRAETCRALELMGTNASRALPELKKLETDAHPDVVEAALAAEKLLVAR